MKKKRRLTKLITDRIISRQCVFEIWKILEDDLIYLIGLYPELDSHFEIGCDELLYYYFNEDNLVMQKEIIEYAFEDTLLKNWEISFEIEIAYKYDTTQLIQTNTSSDLNFTEIDTENKVIKIYLNSLILGNIQHIKDIKKEIIISLVGEVQECLNLKKRKIKDEHLILLDCLMEEILSVMEIEETDFYSAQHEIMFYHKEFFDNWSFEKIENLKNDLDELYELLNV